MNLAPILALLRQEIGLNPASVGEGAVLIALRRRMAAVGCDNLADYSARLSASQEERQELIEEVTVPETWFFREDTAFECLRRHLQSTVPSSGKTCHWHIACLPCATGEEAYSIAMSLLDLGLPPPSFRVHALDISCRALLHAQRGRYGEYSFRALDKTFRARHFQHDGDAYQIDPAVRDQVSFHHGSALLPPTPFNATTYDAVFCRNLLIYLDTEARQRVVTGLKSMLAPDGILLVGHAEVSIALQQGFVRSPDGALRSGSRESLPTAPPIGKKMPRRATSVRASAVPGARSIPMARLPLASLSPSALAAVEIPHQPDVVDAGGDDLAPLRALADAGQLQQAAAHCAERILAGSHSAELYCLQGLVWNAQGDAAAARGCYRKALYLDPQHADARWQLRLLDQREGIERRATTRTDG